MSFLPSRQIDFLLYAIENDHPHMDDCTVVEESEEHF